MSLNTVRCYVSVLSLSHMCKQTHETDIFIPPLFLSLSPLHADFSYKYFYMSALSLPPCKSPSLCLSLSVGCLIAGWEWLGEWCLLAGAGPCPILSSPVLTHKPLFTHWGRGLCSCRYRSYLSVLSCSPGIDHNSLSPHCQGNAIHGTKRMTHHWTVVKWFYFSGEVCFTFECVVYKMFGRSQILLRTTLNTKEIKNTGACC